MPSFGLSWRAAMALRDAGYDQKLDRLVIGGEYAEPWENTRALIHRPDHRTFDESIVGYPKDAPDYYDQGKWRASAYFSAEYLKSDEAETLYFPPLDELIAACGEPFFLACDGGWYAGFGQKNRHVPVGEGSPLFDGYGDTPEDAVAYLWIAVNKKDA